MTTVTQTYDDEQWQLVPKTPDQQMCQQGQWTARMWPRFPLRITSIFQAMLAVAPKNDSVELAAYYVDSKPVTPEQYIAYQRARIASLENARLPEPKFYGGQEEDGAEHGTRCAYVDGWNDCRSAMPGVITPAVEAQSVPVAMTDVDRALIFNAMRSISLNADSLRECHTSDGEDWGEDCEAKADYEADVALLAKLRELHARAAVQGSDGPAITADVHKNAERYVKLREQVWNTSQLFVVAGGRECVKLGVDCPNRERLDEMVDALPEQAARNANSGDTHE